MVMADWTFDPAINSIANLNDAPAGGSNPTLEMQETANTSLLFGVPARSTINGVDITGIRNGQVEIFLKTNGQADSGNVVAFRYEDADNHYRFVFDQSGSTLGLLRVIRRSAGVDTSIFSHTMTDPVPVNTIWFEFRISWWSAAGKLWVKIECAPIGGSYVQQGSITADAGGDFFTGSNTKIAIGLKTAALAGTATFGFDDMKIYSA